MDSVATDLRDVLQKLPLSSTQNLRPDDLVVLLLSIFILVAYLISGKQDPYLHIWYERPQSQHGQTKAVALGNVSIELDEQAKEKDHRLIICFASQSGTAEEHAARLAGECKQKLGISSLVVDLSECNKESFARIPSTIPVIFLVSTYGEGDAPDNGVKFMSWLKSAECKPLKTMHYSALGFGNSTYKFYNQVVTSLETTLESLGAKRLCSTGYVDASREDRDDELMEWKQTLFRQLAQFLDVEERQSATISKFWVRQSEDGTDAPPEPVDWLTRRCASKLPITKLVTLTDSDQQSCLHVEVDTSEHQSSKYRTGDHLILWPENNDDEVKALLTRCGITQLNQSIEIGAFDECNTSVFPKRATVEEMFKYALEIAGPVSRVAAKRLVSYAPHDGALQKLQHLATNKDAFHALGKMTLNELLCHVEPCRKWAIPIPILVDILPQMKPRHYSISSSSVRSPRQVSITVSVHHDARGLATGYLYRQLPPAAAEASSPGKFKSLQVAIRTSKFRLPLSHKTPLIMIAAGTGIAPFRAFIQERSQVHQMKVASGRMLLFMGCRRPEDFIYREELNELEAVLGSKLAIRAAYSRTGAVKEYVQDRVKKEIGQVLDAMLNDNATLYICGAAAVAHGVSAVFAEALMERNDWTEKEWQEFKTQKRKQRKWMEDVW